MGKYKVKLVERINFKTGKVVISSEQLIKNNIDKVINELSKDCESIELLLNDKGVQMKFKPYYGEELTAEMGDFIVRYSDIYPNVLPYTHVIDVIPNREVIESIVEKERVINSIKYQGKG